VVEIETQLSPADVLARLRAYERTAGRAENHARNSPRGIDLDLLYAGDARIDAPEMTLPHPRMTSRRFVLQPLADIRPDLVIPGEKDTVSSLLASLPAAPAVRLVEDRW
jgi:2-amino-4-hydroxy-6-hydroxymethyldihydropteridine diphosphokinase